MSEASEPEYSDLLEDEIEVNDCEASKVISKLDAARTSAAYWRGRCEGLEIAMEKIQVGHDLTLGYLKDRLNKLEGKREGGIQS